MRIKNRIMLIYLALTAVVCFALGACEKGGGASQRDLYVISANFDGKRTLSATQKVFLTNRGEGEMRRIYFHLYPRAYEADAQFRATESISDYGKITIDGVSMSAEGCHEIEGEDRDILAIVPSVPLLPGENMNVTIDFTLTLPVADHRLGITALGNANFGNWYPVLCAENDTSPYYSFGDPFVSECADYEVSISVPDGVDVIMTGKEKVGETSGGRSYCSSVKNVRDFAFVVGKFDKMQAQIGKTTVSYYYSKDENAKESLDAATAAIATFSRLFGQYPYDDYDVVQTLPGSGGMEYPCLSMVSAMLNKSLYIESIVHETAHQWWYALVGNNQITTAWLDEGLAEYSTTIFYEKNPEYGVSLCARIADASAAYLMYLDLSIEKTHALNRSLSEFLSPTDYTYMAYVKGELFFHSLRELVGDEAFFSGLRRYFNENCYKIAWQDSFIAAMEAQSGKPLKGYWDGWLEGKDVVAK